MSCRGVSQTPGTNWTDRVRTVLVRGSLRRWVLAGEEALGSPLRQCRNERSGSASDGRSNGSRPCRLGPAARRWPPRYGKAPPLVCRRWCISCVHGLRAAAVNHLAVQFCAGPGGHRETQTSEKDKQHRATRSSLFGLFGRYLVHCILHSLVLALALMGKCTIGGRVPPLAGMAAMRTKWLPVSAEGSRPGGDAFP